MTREATTMLQTLVRVAVEIARFMRGFAGYDAYVRRERADHPNLPLMTYDEFIERQTASDDHALRRQA